MTAYLICGLAVVGIGAAVGIPLAIAERYRRERKSGLLVGRHWWVDMFCWRVRLTFSVAKRDNEYSRAGEYWAKQEVK